jgi:multiple sugar transport system permease protein
MASVASAPPRATAAAAKRRRIGARLARRSTFYVLLLAGAATTLFPFLWMVSTSLKQDLAVFATPPQLIPKPFEPSNYRNVATIFPIWRFLFNSAVVAFFSTTLQVLTSAMAAYGFSRFTFRGQSALFVLYLATMMVPFQVIVVPLFVEMRYLHLVDTYPALILPTIASAFGTFLLRQAIAQLPRELEEAAFVDGAGHLTVFFKIVLPLAKPSLVTFGILSFMSSWNSFLWPFVVTNSTKLMTLPVGLANLQGEHLTQWNLVMAGTTISVVPIVVVYLFSQRHIVQGFVLSGVKG